MEPSTHDRVEPLTEHVVVPLTEQDVLTAPTLIAGDATDLIAALEAGAERRGLDAVVVSVADGETVATSAISAIDLEPGSARLVVLAIRRRGSVSPIARAIQLAGRLETLLAHRHVVIVVTVKGVTELAPDKLERLLTREILHQVEFAIAPSATRPPWRRFRLRLGLAALDAAGVRVLRLRTRGV